MDKDRVKGIGKQVAGSVQEAAGKVTGDAKLKAEGKAEKAAGRVQNAVGGVKDAVRGKKLNQCRRPSLGAAFFFALGRKCEPAKIRCAAHGSRRNQCNSKMLTRDQVTIVSESFASPLQAGASA